MCGHDAQSLVLSMLYCKNGNAVLTEGILFKLISDAEILLRKVFTK